MGPSNKTQDFDPYHQWLSIPPQHQPANFYRLLGLDLYESDHDVIDVAANRQVAYLRQVGVGARGPIAARLIDEIRSARKLLLNEKARQRYDRELRATLPAESAGPAKPAKGSRGPAIVIDDGTSQPSTKTARRQDSSVGRAKHDQRAKKHVNWKIPAAICSIIVLVGLIIFLATRGGSSGESVNRPVRPNAATPRVASSKAFKSVPSGTRKSVQPTPRRSNPSRTAAHPSSSIADAFERASKDAGKTLPSKNATSKPPAPPSEADATSKPQASSSQAFAPAISWDEIDGLEQIDTLPNVEDFEDATCLERFRVAEEEVIEEWYELSHGYLRVRQTKDLKNMGMTLHRDDIQIAAGDSVAFDLGIPKWLKRKSQILISIGDYQWTLQIKEKDSLLIWGAYADADSGELTMLPYPMPNRQPYQLLITRRSDDSALDWWLQTPKQINKVYVGSIVRPSDSDGETSADGDILKICMVAYGESERRFFWIDNIRHGQLEQQPEVSKPESITPPTQ